MKKIFISKSISALKYFLLFIAAHTANAVELHWDAASEATSAVITSGGEEHVLSPNNPIVNIPGRDDINVLPTFAEGGAANQARFMMLTINGSYNLRVTGNHAQFNVTTSPHQDREAGRNP